MPYGKFKHLTYYWATSNNLEFTEKQKVEGSIYINEQGLIFGIVKDRNNLHSEEHVICGMQVQSHFILVDVRNFAFLNPHEMIFDLDTDYGEAISSASTIGYTKLPTPPNKVILSKYAENDLSLGELMFQHYKWLQVSTPASAFFLQKLFFLFTNCLEQCQGKRLEEQKAIFQECIDQVKIKYGEDKIRDYTSIVTSPYVIGDRSRLRKIG